MAKPRKKKQQKPASELVLEGLNKGTLNFEELCNHSGLLPRDLRQILADLQKAEVNIQMDEDTGFYYIVAPENVGPEDKEWDHKLANGFHRVAFISDTHLGGHHQQLTYLHEFYRRAIDLGVSRFYHSGDLCDGDGFVYRGQINEIFAHGFEYNVDYVEENYPKHAGVKTFFILGNHDLSWWSRSGIDIGHSIAARRKDMVYMGQGGAYSRLTDKARVYLHHPDGGAAYALSYKLQRFIEGFAQEAKPEVLASGHLHSTLYSNYQGVDALMVPCFQSQNIYLKRKGLHPVVGGWVVEFMLEGGEIREFAPRLIKWKTPIVKDF